MTPDRADVAGRLDEVRAVMRAAGDADDAVRIIAVTKGFGPDAVRAAAAAGLDDVGENYADDLLSKRAVEPSLRRHFIGRLQSNKIARLAGSVDLWQTIDRPKLVRLLARHDPGAALLVQVDISGESSKGGCDPDAVAPIVEAASASGLEVRGLMGIAAVAETSIVRAQFAHLRGLVDELGLEECSMGMSGDLAVAVAEGATMVRVGTALFGPRPS